MSSAFIDSAVWELVIFNHHPVYRLYIVLQCIIRGCQRQGGRAEWQRQTEVCDLKMKFRS